MINVVCNRETQTDSNQLLTEEEILNIANADSRIDFDVDEVIINGVKYYINSYN